MHYIEGFGAQVKVIFNDQINFDEINDFDKVVLSPGPGLPKNAGLMPDFIDRFYDKIPILGVCLGFQAIYEFLGGKLFNLPEVKHGVAEKCNLSSESTLFQHINNPIKVGLYHSWAVDEDSKPKDIKFTATSDSNVIMAYEHSFLPIYGVQFHPESVLTEKGHQIIKNFLEA